MSTDFRKLCREMYDAFTAHARTDKQHDLLDRVQIALKEPPTKGSGNPWKDVLEDALVCAFLLNEENQSDPKKALHDLISWEIQLAKDPLINPPTQPVPIAERLPGPEDCLVIKNTSWEMRYCWLAKSVLHAGIERLIWEWKPLPMTNELNWPWVYWLPASTQLLPTSSQPQRN